LWSLERGSRKYLQKTILKNKDENISPNYAIAFIIAISVFLLIDSFSELLKIWRGEESYRLHDGFGDSIIMIILCLIISIALLFTHKNRVISIIYLIALILCSILLGEIKFYMIFVSSTLYLSTHLFALKLKK
jgi:hypothetical protein